MLPASNLPIRTKNFIGRENYLEMIDSAFNKETKQIVVLNSFSGTGKTSIANEYSYRFKSTGFVYWIKPEIGEMNLFASDLGIQLSNEEKQQKSKIIDKIKSNIEGIFKDNADKFNFLFIFDNFDDNDDENDINYIIKLSDITNSKILITTKDKNIKDKFRQENLLECSQFIELEPFDDSESVKFIKQNLNEIIKNEIEVNNLIEFFEIKSQKRRPIALNKMITLIKLKLEKNHSLDTVINDLKLKGKNKLEEIIIDDEFESDINPEIASTLKNIGIIFQEIDKSKEAIKYYNQSLEAYKIINGTDINTDIADILHEIGYSYEHDFDYENAIKFYNKSLEINRKLFKTDFNPKIAGTLNNIGNIYKQICDYENALKYYNESLKIQRTDINPDVASILKNIGLCYEAAFKYDEAFEYFFKSLELYRQLNDTDFNLNTYSLLFIIGNIFFNLENFEISIDYLRYCLKIRENLSPNDIVCAALFFQIGEAYLKTSKYEEALDNYQKCLDLYRKIYGNYNYSAIAQILNRIISLVIRMNQY